MRKQHLYTVLTHHAVQLCICIQYIIYIFTYIFPGFCCICRKLYNVKLCIIIMLLLCFNIVPIYHRWLLFKCVVHFVCNIDLVYCFRCGGGRDGNWYWVFQIYRCMYIFLTCIVFSFRLSVFCCCCIEYISVYIFSISNCVFSFPMYRYVMWRYYICCIINANVYVSCNVYIVFQFFLICIHVYLCISNKCLCFIYI